MLPRITLHPLALLLARCYCTANLLRIDPDCTMIPLGMTLF
jgi:hypothetical protein